MKKFLAFSLSLGLAISLAGCFGLEDTPVTEETQPLPLWAQEESSLPLETSQEPVLTEAPAETAPPATVSQLPEDPTVTLPPELATLETEATEAPTEETEPLPTYSMEEKFDAIAPETVFATRNVNIRSQANVESDNLGKLAQGKEVTRVGTSHDGWSAVLIEDKVRYIASEYLSKEEPEPTENPNVPSEMQVDDMVYTVDDVNMREGPGFDHAILCRVPEFVELHRTGIVSSGWCRVTYKDQEGFIYVGYLAEDHPGSSDETVAEDAVDDIVYTTRELNFRSGPSTRKAIIGRIPEGAKLQRIAIADNNWAKVVYEGQTGYVSGDYVTTEVPAEG